VVGPVIGRWYRFLELKFPLPTHGGKVTSLTALSKRVAVDQLVMAPIGVRHIPIRAPTFAVALILDL
jgi:protein Mpv17